MAPLTPMRLTLNTPPAAAGLRWFQAGLREVIAQPLGYAGLFALFMFGALVLSMLPAVGGLLLLMAMPLLSLAFVMAAAGRQRELPVRAAVLLAPWRSGPIERRRRLFLLCLSYALAMTLMLWLAQVLDGGRFDAWVAMTAEGKGGSDEWVALAEDNAVMLGALARLVLGSLISLLYWHAPPLVQWADQGVAQALFSSALALWRGRAAFFVYNACWVLISVPVLLLQTIAPALGLLTLPLWLLLTTAFYASLYASFLDSFTATPD